MIRNKIVLLCLLICLHLLAGAQTPAPVKWLLQAPYMRGASFSLVVKDVQDEERSTVMIRTGCNRPLRC